MGILFPSSQSGLLNQSSAQVIDGSLKLNSAKSQVLTRTPAVERNRKTWTFSFWVKLFQNSQTFIGVFGLSGSGASQTGLDIRFNAAFQLAVSNQVNNSNAWSLVSTAVHRDTGWYHVVIAHDTTKSVEEDRLKMYVNGKQITSFQTSSYPTLNYESSLNKALPHRIGSWDDGGSIYAPMEGMLTNVYMIEGKSLGPGYFGSTDPLTGTWRPRKASADFRILGSGLIYSSYGSGTVSGVKGYTRAFDGNLSLFCEPNDNSTVTFDFTSLPGGGITVGSSLRMYLNKAGSPAAGHFTVNGTNLGGSVPSGGWLTIGSVSRLDTITFYHASGSSSVELYAVEIDGVVLVDGTATKTTVNDGTVWSGGWTGTVMSGYNYTESFDGILGTDANNSTRPDSNQTITWTNPKGSTPFENLRLWCINDGGDAIVRVNGHDVTNQVGDAGYSNAEWYTITNVGKSLSSIQLVAGSSNSPFLWGVEVDGGTMVDSTTQKLDFGPNGFYLPMDGNSSIGEDKSGKGNDWTPVNFSGFTTLDKSTGAFPILNTVSGGNFASSGTRTDANASPNDGTVWSNALVGDASGFQGAATAADGFNGVVGSSNNQYAQNNTGSNPSTITFTPPGGIPFTQSIEVYLINADNTVNVNGEGAQTIAANEWVTVKTGSGTLSTIVFSRASTGGASFSAIKVDGHILKDSSYEGLAIALPLIGKDNDVSSNFRKRVVGTLTRLRFKTDWNWMYVSAIEINGTILTTGTLDNSGSVWTDPDKWKNGSVGSGQETYSQSARGDWFDVTLASSIQLETLRIYVYLDSSSGSTTNIFELELFFNDISNLTKVISSNNGAPNGNFNQRSWQDFKDVRTKILASNGNAVASSEQSNFYGGSFKFDGTTDFLSTGGSTDYVVNGIDWTVEFFLYADSTSGVNILIENTSNGGGGWSVQLNSGNIQVYLSSGVALLSTAVEANKWYHIALVRSSSTTSLYIDGISRATTSVDAGSTASDGLTIGARANGDYSLDGYIQDVRLYKGVAKYTSNFVVASSSPDIFPDSPSGVSGGSKLTKITDGAVDFDGDDYLELADSDDWDFGTGDFTVECFAYFNDTTSVNSTMVNRWGGDGNIWTFQIVSSTQNFRFYTNSGNVATPNNSIHKDKWYHFAASRTSGTLKLFIDGVEEASDSFTVNLDGSSRLNVGAEVGTASLATKGFISNVRVIKGTGLYTSAFTPPISPLTNVTNTKLLCCQSNTSAATANIVPDSLLNAPLSATAFTDSSPTGASITNTGSIATTSAGTNSFNITNAASLNGSSQRLSTNNTNISFINSWTVDVYFKLDSSASDFNAIINSGYGSQTSNYLYIGIDDDEKPYIETSSRTTASDAISKNVWYHGRIIQDLSNIKFYVNGTSVVTHARNTTDLSSAGTFTIGSLLDNGNNVNNFHGLIGPVRVFASDIGDPTSGGNATTGGALSNISGTPGTVSVNGNAAATTFNQFNFDTNTVHGNPSNYCTWNPLFIDAGGTNNRSCNLSNGNLTAESPNSGDWNIALGTVQVSRGKYYWELTHLQGNVSCMMGVIANTNGGMFNSNYAFYYNPLTWTYYLSTGKKRNGSASGDAYGTAGVNGDVIGVAIDLDKGTISISKNGVSMGVMYDNLPAGEEFTPIWGASKQSTTNQVSANFGQKPFKYAPPEGHGTLSSAGARKDTVISRPDQYVGVTTYTGTTGSGTIKDDNIKFTPDFVWLKSRSNSEGHALYDTVRGSTGGNFYRLRSDTTAAQNSPTNELSSMIEGGFTVNNNGHCYSNGYTYVAWTWKAGGNKNTFNVDDVGYASATAAGLDAGSLNPTAASVGTKQGFSIIKADPNQSAETIAHGLGKKPAFIISKPIDSSSLDWNVFHQSLGTSEFLRLNTTAGDQNSNHYWGASVTTTTFGVAAGNNGNNQDNPIYYVWADVPGLQKFGSYKGIEDASGPFVELGFRPALIWVKNVDSGAGHWVIVDNKRDLYNPEGTKLAANLANGDYLGGSFREECDFLSNGFKMRGTSTDSSGMNKSDTYIYCAWAEAPTVNLYGAQSNAR
jgi:hypothetical protein